jgi:hypothetical protein
LQVRISNHPTFNNTVAETAHLACRREPILFCFIGYYLIAPFYGALWRASLNDDFSAAFGAQASLVTLRERLAGEHQHC